MNMGKNLKLLTVGNSFSDDMMEHVFQIARNMGVEEISLGNLYYPACSLAKHAAFFRENAPVYEYRTNTHGTWHTRENARFPDAFENVCWDCICFQESAQLVQSDRANYVHLPDLIQAARAHCPEAKILWHMPWSNPHPNYGGDAGAMYRDLCQAVRTHILHRVDMVIPCGTAIENFRAGGKDADLLLLRDGWHLSADVGRFLAGMTLVGQVTGLPVDRVGWTPSRRVEAILPRIQSAVKAALNTPFSVTAL